MKFTPMNLVIHKVHTSFMPRFMVIHTHYQLVRDTHEPYEPYM